MCFVLSTLLNGRRRLDVQERLHAHRLDTVICSIWPTMSFTTDIVKKRNIGKKRTVENAFRIQYLRLIHDYYDRDFYNNKLKGGMLTDIDVAMTHGENEGKESSGAELASASILHHGLLHYVVHQISIEPCDSMFRFWLSSIIETFVRGSTGIERDYVGR